MPVVSSATSGVSCTLLANLPAAQASSDYCHVGGQRVRLRNTAMSLMVSMSRLWASLCALSSS